jgi:hypothetical protein
MLTVIFGSNWFINTNGIVTFVDAEKSIKKELFRIELRDDLQPMVTVEIRDAQDLLLGKAYRSTSFVGVNEDYETSTERSGSDVRRMLLKNKKTNKVVFELINHGSRKEKVREKEVINYIVEINGVFHIKGYPYPIEATSQYLDINTNKLIGNKKFGGGFGIELTPNTLAF